MSTAYTLTLRDVAARFGLTDGRKMIANLARENSIGLPIGGKAGWRFSESDVERLTELMRPTQTKRLDKRKRGF